MRSRTRAGKRKPVQPQRTADTSQHLVRTPADPVRGAPIQGHTKKKARDDEQSHSRYLGGHSLWGQGMYLQFVAIEEAHGSTIFGHVYTHSCHVATRKQHAVFVPSFSVVLQPMGDASPSRLSQPPCSNALGVARAVPAITPKAVCATFASSAWRPAIPFSVLANALCSAPTGFRRQFDMPQGKARSTESVLARRLA